MAIKGLRWAVLAGLAVFVIVPGVSADDGDDVGNEPPQTLDSILQRLEALENADGAKQAPPTEVKAPEEESGGLTAWLRQAAKAVEVHGFVDAGYMYNLSRPATRQNGNSGDTGLFDAMGEPLPGVTAPVYDGTPIRAFDQGSNQFYIHQAQLRVAKEATADSRAGFLVKIVGGRDVMNTTSNADNVAVQEAQVDLLVPIGGKDISVSIGKMATLAGYEVIESADNMNYSRSLPFFLAIPFLHVGARATYSFTDDWSFTLGVNNGWDTIDDITANDSKTLELQLAGGAGFLSGAVTAYYGSEKTRTAGAAVTPGSGGMRSLIDITLTAAEIPGLDGWTFGANLDIGSEEDAVVDANGQDATADWMGWALYAAYDHSEYIAPRVRVSALDDDDAFRTKTKQSLMEVTLTNEIQVLKEQGLIMRIELRMDTSDEDVFLDGSDPDDNETTIGFEAIYSF